MGQNLTNAECAELARVLRQAIQADRYPLTPRVRRWRELLAKLDPSAKPPVEPYPPPKPPGEQLHLLRRKSRRR
jgi:hypothetical protein